MRFRSFSGRRVEEGISRHADVPCRKLKMLTLPENVPLEALKR